MMTREEVEATLKQARKFGGYGLDLYFESLLNHDAEQRQRIEQLEHQNAALREALRRIVDLLGECRLDHHGNCREHFISDLCEVKQARQALKEHP